MSCPIGERCERRVLPFSKRAIVALGYGQPRLCSFLGHTPVVLGGMKDPLREIRLLPADARLARGHAVRADALGPRPVLRT